MHEIPTDCCVFINKIEAALQKAIQFDQPFISHFEKQVWKEQNTVTITIGSEFHTGNYVYIYIFLIVYFGWFYQIYYI